MLFHTHQSTEIPPFHSRPIWPINNTVHQIIEHSPFDISSTARTITEYVGLMCVDPNNRLNHKQ